MWLCDGKASIVCVAVHACTVVPVPPRRRIYLENSSDLEIFTENQDATIQYAHTWKKSVSEKCAVKLKSTSKGKKKQEDGGDTSR